MVKMVMLEMQVSQEEGEIEELLAGPDSQDYQVRNADQIREFTFCWFPAFLVFQQFHRPKMLVQAMQSQRFIG